MKYVRKRIEFDAVQWHDDMASVQKVRDFLTTNSFLIEIRETGITCFVNTKKQGRRAVSFGDWILRGYLGGIHVFMNEEFVARYEAQKEETP